MAQQKKSIAISFRLPVELTKRLRKTIEHTKWVQMVVLKALGKCPVCMQDLPEQKDDEKEKLQ